MCGITGFIDFTRENQISVLSAMTSTLKHRGPDGQGTKIWKHKSANIGFGHTRLSIIDLTENGHQPMIIDELAITFNGEIYNYRKIKSELIEMGHHFSSDSDTEVILKSYQEWGLECVNKFRGMFAFVIYDIKNEKIHLVRDRLGIKPLFVYTKGNFHMFSSELKAFHTNPKFEKRVNRESVALFLKYGFIPSPKSIFQDVVKLNPGSYLTINLRNQQLSEQFYWKATDYLKDTDEDFDYKNIEDEIHQTLTQSFQFRMVADVPVGVFLSGGYDSSLVTAILQNTSKEKINTFTIGFENENYDESFYAERIAKVIGTNHSQQKCTKKEAQDIIHQLPFYYDEPFADSSSIPTFLVSRLASKKVKVALSSDGGDELFAGYNRNLRFLDINRKINKIPSFLSLPFSVLAAIISKLYVSKISKKIWWEKLSILLEKKSLLNIFDVYPQVFTDNIIDKMLKGIKSSTIDNPQKLIIDGLQKKADEFNALLTMDYISTLTNDMLVKVDRATMANGLEGREPLLDHKIFELVASIPSKYKLKDGVLKSILKSITHKYLPKSIMDRPKMGFGIPISQWLKSDLSNLVDKYLSKDSFKKYGLLEPEYTFNLVQNVKKNKTDEKLLWNLLTLQMWCEKWLD